MNEIFDYERFENLRGVELGLHFAKWGKDNLVDEKFIDYFRTHSSVLDDEHLEVGLFLIAKTRRTDAHREIAKYMRHRCMSVRVLAINIISQFPLVDETIRESVVSVLADPIDPQEVRELRQTLNHPQN